MTKRNDFEFWMRLIHRKPELARRKSDDTYISSRMQNLYESYLESRKTRRYYKAEK